MFGKLDSKSISFGELLRKRPKVCERKTPAENPYYASGRKMYQEAAVRKSKYRQC